MITWKPGQQNRGVFGTLGFVIIPMSNKERRPLVVGQIDDDCFGNELGVGLFSKAINHDELARVVEELTARVAKFEAAGEIGEGQRNCFPRDHSSFQEPMWKKPRRHDQNYSN